MAQLSRSDLIQLPRTAAGVENIVRPFAVVGWVFAGTFLFLLAHRGRPRPRLPHRELAELQAAITHIAYEYVALSRASEDIRAASPDILRRDLEVALLHARNLTEFFWAWSNGTGRSHG